MKKIYNLPGLVKRCFLLTLLASVMTISYGQTVNQKSYDETQGSSVATPSLTENMSLKHGFKLIFDVGYQYQLESFFADVNRIKFNVVGIINSILMYLPELTRNAILLRCGSFSIPFFTT